MRQPLQISFRGMAPSPSMEERIREYAGRLDTVFDGIMGCRVTVEEPHKHHQKGNPLLVRVDLTVPGQELVAESQHVESSRQKSAHDALHEAFERAERQLEKYIARRRS